MSRFRMSWSNTGTLSLSRSCGRDGMVAAQFTPQSKTFDRRWVREHVLLRWLFHTLRSWCDDSSYLASFTRKWPSRWQADLAGLQFVPASVFFALYLGVVALTTDHAEDLPRKQRRTHRVGAVEQEPPMFISDPPQVVPPPVPPKTR